MVGKGTLERGAKAIGEFECGVDAAGAEPWDDGEPVAVVVDAGVASIGRSWEAGTDYACCVADSVVAVDTIQADACKSVESEAAGTDLDAS